MKLVPFTMWLDPEEPEDIEVIKHLKPKIKRRKVSAELRAAMLFYLKHLRRKAVTDSQEFEEWEPESPEGELGRARTAPKRAEPDNVPTTAKEAAGTFLKRSYR